MVIGPYVNYEISTVESCAGTECLKVNNNLAAGLHLGYAVSDRGQLYAKVGYARLSITASSGAASASENGGGPEGAIGYEHGFSSNFYGRIEFGYGDNGEILGLNVQRRHAGVTLGMRF